MKMKKLRPILGISLLVQSLTFFVLFLVNAERKKNLSRVFAAFSAIGGVAGAALLVYDAKERKKAAEEFNAEDYFDEILDDFDEFDIDEDDIVCSFEEVDEATEEEQA